MNYYKDIPQNIRENIDMFMKPFLNSNPNASQGSDLEIKFDTFNSNQVLGKIIRSGKKEAIEILTFGITNLE